MIIKQLDQIDALIIDINQKLLNNVFYLDLNNNLKEDFKRSRGPLRGVVFDLKLNFLTKEYKTDSASLILRNFIPSYNCTLYELMLAQGALFVGKTNCDEFCAGSLGVNSVYGPVFYQNCYTGGSSSGAGYTAKMFVDVAFGTDTGGSCRFPALLTRVYSYKPSFGGISRYGIIEYSKSLDCVGALFRDPNIMLNVFNHIVQPDSKDSMSNLIRKHKTSTINPSLSILYSSAFNEYEIPILTQLKNLYKYESSNVTFNFESINNLYHAKSCMDIFSECFKFDKPRYHNNQHHSLEDLANYQKERYNQFGNYLKNKFAFGALILSDPEYRDKYYQQIHKEISKIMLTLNTLTKDKILVFPSLFPDIDNTEAILKLANFAGLPSITIPISDSIKYMDNIPLKYSGLILIGGYGQDLELLTIAQQYYKQTI